MKEATGELNMTVVTVVAIAAVGVFFYALIWPGIQRSLRLSAACSAAGTGHYEDTYSNDDKIVCDMTTTGEQCTLQVNGTGKATTKSCDQSAAE